MSPRSLFMGLGRSTRLVFALLLLAGAHGVHAQVVRFERVAEGVYAHIGELGGRTAANQGLNANIGLVLTPGGAVLIDSGATARSAQRIHEAVRQVTSLPVKWVINTGGQDHRWLGNGYFKAQGAQLIAHTGGEADMRNRGNDHVEALRAALGDGVDGTVPTLPDRWVRDRIAFRSPMTISQPRSADEPALLADGLTRRLGERVAVDHVSFSVGRGEVFGFLGPNGAGKSTTARMLTGYIPPTAGRALVAGFDVARSPTAARPATRPSGCTAWCTTPTST